MKKLILLLIFLAFIFDSDGCIYMVGAVAAANQEKERMDISDQLYVSVDDLWDASLKVAEVLGIIVDKKEFDGRKGLISGHVGEIDFIRIHLERIKAKDSVVGIQARTSSTPLGRKGYKEEFAKSIMEQIKKELGLNSQDS